MHIRRLVVPLIAAALFACASGRAPNTPSPPPRAPTAIDLTTQVPADWVAVEHDGRWIVHVPPTFVQKTWNAPSQTMWSSAGSYPHTAVVFGQFDSHRLDQPRRRGMIRDLPCSVYEARWEGPAKGEDDFYIDVAIGNGDADGIFVGCRALAEEASTCRQIVGSLRRKGPAS